MFHNEAWFLCIFIAMSQCVACSLDDVFLRRNVRRMVDRLTSSLSISSWIGVRRLAGCCFIFAFNSAVYVSAIFYLNTFLLPTDLCYGEPSFYFFWVLPAVCLLIHWMEPPWSAWSSWSVFLHIVNRIRTVSLTVHLVYLQAGSQLAFGKRLFYLVVDSFTWCHLKDLLAFCTLLEIIGILYLDFISLL